jgi:hypothetical protein
MSVEFSTPLAALIALAVVLPLAGFFAVSRRAERLRHALGLPEPSLRRRMLPAGAILGVAGLLGLAAAQPLLQTGAARRVRSDAQVFVLVDITRSMLAQSKPGAPSRIERAKAAAAKIRASLPGVPVGIASLTNRVLPYLFPTGDEGVFRATLADAIAVDNPPPGASAFVIGQPVANATRLNSLVDVAARRFYSPGVRHRLLVVLTDGETLGLYTADIAQRLRAARIRTIYVQFWHANEHVYTNGFEERQYSPNPDARSILEDLAAATHGKVYEENDLAGAVQDAHHLLGKGPMRVVAGSQAQPLALGPYVAGIAFLPLVLLLWRRSR